MSKINRRDFILLAGSGILYSCKGFHLESLKLKKKPNIIYILADDLGCGDPSCINKESKIKTPNIDSLASEGIIFTDAHSPSSVCTPTRYGILTGRYAWRTRLKKGVLGGYSRPLIEPGRATIASILKEQGYNTGCVGKWHLGIGWKLKNPSKRPRPINILWNEPIHSGPKNAGFDRSLIIPASLDMPPYCWIEDHKVVEIPNEHTKGSKRRWSGGKGFWRAGPIAKHFRFELVLSRICSWAENFIKQQTKEKPFFLYMALNAPHTPWVPRKEFIGKSNAGYYGDFVTEVDWVVGRILRTLKEKGFDKNTVIFFTSDNGSHWPKDQIKKYNHYANMHYRGMKADIWDGGHRIPLIVKWPGISPKGKKCKSIICLTDLTATVASYLGLKLPYNAAEDSLSMLPVIEDPENGKPKRDIIVHHSLDGMFAIRKDRWKLILGRGSGGFTRPRRIKPKKGEALGQLYDMENDPGETKNLYNEKPKIVNELKEILMHIKKHGRSR